MIDWMNEWKNEYVSKYVSEWILYACSIHDIFYFLILTKTFDY